MGWPFCIPSPETTLDPSASLVISWCPALGLPAALKKCRNYDYDYDYKLNVSETPVGNHSVRPLTKPSVCEWRKNLSGTFSCRRNWEIFEMKWEGLRSFTTAAGLNGCHAPLCPNHPIAYSSAAGFSYVHVILGWILRPRNCCRFSFKCIGRLE